MHVSSIMVFTKYCMHPSSVYVTQRKLDYKSSRKDTLSKNRHNKSQCCLYRLHSSI